MAALGTSRDSIVAIRRYSEDWGEDWGLAGALSKDSRLIPYENSTDAADPRTASGRV